MAQNLGLNTAELSTSPSKVRFNEEDVMKHNLEIVLEYETSDNGVTIQVHLGFLKLRHHYRINVDIEDKLGEDVVIDPLQNLNAKIEQCMPSENGAGHSIVINLNACKEKIMKEMLSITNKNKQTVNILLVARVLGKGKGTPALKHGIHCTGSDPDEESELSDWTGFGGKSVDP